jgi:hypothetical protein
MRSLLALAAVWAGMAGAANAHDWYPARCCGGYDCRMLPATSVTAVNGGWLIGETGEVFPYGKEDDSPDGQFHRCENRTWPRLSNGQYRTRCLFVPNLGA